LRWAVNAPVLPEEAAPELGAYAELAVRLGRLFTQLAGRLPAEIRAGYHGQIAQLPSTAAITATLTAGVLQPVSTVPVNWVNAPHLAGERGVRVVEQADPTNAGGRTSLLRISAPDPAAPSLAGTV